MTEPMTLDGMVDSLTGFEELAITKHFDHDVPTLLNGHPTTLMRALVFVAQRREGLDDKAAKKAAMEMTLGEVQAQFTDDDEPMPDEPVTPTGKDAEPPGSQP